MILTEKHFRAERGKTAETYQGFTVTLEIEVKRNYITVQLDNMTRWRSTAEYADYLRWAADEIETLDIAKETLQYPKAIRSGGLRPPPPSRKGAKS